MKDNEKLRGVAAVNTIPALGIELEKIEAEIGDCRDRIRRLRERWAAKNAEIRNRWHSPNQLIFDFDGYVPGKEEL